MNTWKVPLADAENGRTIDYRMSGNWDPNFGNIESTVIQFAIGQCSYETKRKVIFTGPGIELIDKLQDADFPAVEHDLPLQ